MYVIVYFRYLIATAVGVAVLAAIGVTDCTPQFTDDV